MNKEDLIYFGHIKLTIQSDYTCDNGEQHYNDAVTMQFTTISEQAIKSIVLEDEKYHKSVVEVLKIFIDEYKEKYLH